MTENEAIELFKERLTLIKEHCAEEVKDYEEALEIGIQALEKQISKKPVNYDKHYYKCPCCNEDLEIDNDMSFVYDEEPPKFCINCGQKLDWSDEE